MNEFFSFRRMVTPYIIMIIFWVLVVSLVLSLIAMTIGVIGASSQKGGESILLSLCCIWPIGLPLGFLGIRIFCELTILFFRMNETLTDIKNDLSRKV